MSEILGEKPEEILERLWIATFEAGKPCAAAEELGVEDAEQAVIELEGLGFLSRRDGSLVLREEGFEPARRMVRRHRLAERLFIDVFDVKGDLSEESACRFEHMLHKGIEEKICTLLGHPRFCPHGKPIPPGNCCREARESAEKVVAPLAGLSPGQAGTIAYVHSENPRKVQKLIAMGILPGSPITLIGRAPSFSFKVGYSQFAVDEDLAGDIYVRLDAAKDGGRIPVKRRSRG